MTTRLLVAVLLLATLPSTSAIMPQPQHISPGNTTLHLHPSFWIRINISPNRSIPQDLRRAVARTRRSIVSSRTELVPVPVTPADEYNVLQSDPGFHLRELILSLKYTSYLPLKPSIAEESVRSLEERREGYELIVPGDGAPARLVAETTLGLLRGLTTFQQLWYVKEKMDNLEPEERSAGCQCQDPVNTLLRPTAQHCLRCISGPHLPSHFTPFAPYLIRDFPTYSYRGLLLDTSRNFFPLHVIRKSIIDGMSLVKLNTLHWHITDSHSWPLLLETHPELAERGAYSSDEVYTEQDVKDLTEYAAERGIDIIIEVDLPGHTASIGSSHPELVACSEKQPWKEYANEPPAGQLRFVLEEARVLVEGVLNRVSGLVRSAYFGLGGDEVNMRCFQDDGVFQQALLSQNISFETALNQFTSSNIEAIHPKIPIIWQDLVLSHNLTSLPAETIVLAWDPSTDIEEILRKGYRVVQLPSDYMYLDCGAGSWEAGSESGRSWCDPYKTWERIYSYDPLENVTRDLQHLIIGGEAALWTEQTDEHNLDAKVWPRAAAAAEVFWSGSARTDESCARIRMHEIRSRLVEMGVQAAALQPRWCVQNPGKC